MIRKIISGGQTGADQAALDVAIKLGIPHGGWIPKGRMTEAGPLPDKYSLQEMDTTSYEKRTEQNVIDSDGTLILSHGPLTGGSLYTRKMAEKHGRPFLHIDFNKMRMFEAALKASTWILKNKIAVVNVAGPRASKDPRIYRLVSDVLESTVNLSKVEKNEQDEETLKLQVPKTVEEAVERLIAELSLEDRTKIANMSKSEIDFLHANIGTYIRNKFELWEGNNDLIASCELNADEKSINPDRAAAIIIDALWKELQETHKLRILK